MAVNISNITALRYVRLMAWQQRQRYGSMRTNSKIKLNCDFWTKKGENIYQCEKEANHEGRHKYTILNFEGEGEN